MTKPNITPGPYQVLPFGSEAWNVQGSLYRKIGTEICPAPIALLSKEADAQAHAAVPDLLAALELAHDILKEARLYLTGDLYQECTETLDTIKAALTKAGYTFP